MGNKYQFFFSSLKKFTSEAQITADLAPPQTTGNWNMWISIFCRCKTYKCEHWAHNEMNPFDDYGEQTLVTPGHCTRLAGNVRCSFHQCLTLPLGVLVSFPLLCWHRVTWQVPKSTGTAGDAVYGHDSRPTASGFGRVRFIQTCSYFHSHARWWHCVAGVHLLVKEQHLPGDC